MAVIFLLLLRQVDLLKLNVERAEADCFAGVKEEDWPKIKQVSAQVRCISHAYMLCKEVNLSSYDQKPRGKLPMVCLWLIWLLVFSNQGPVLCPVLPCHV